MHPAIAESVKAVILFVRQIAMFILPLEDIIKKHLGQKLGLLCPGNFNLLYIATDITLFIGEKVELIAVSANQYLPFQALQALFDLTLEGESIGIHFIDAEGHQVVDIRFDQIYITD